MDYHFQLISEIKLQHFFLLFGQHLKVSKEINQLCSQELITLTVDIITENVINNNDVREKIKGRN